MRHRIKKPRLNREVGSRKSLIKNLLTALYVKGAIITTQSKANAIQPAAERLISIAKKQTLASLRQISSTLNHTEAGNRLVNSIAPAFADTNSGFTRKIKIGHRRGDNALMVKLELVKQPVVATIVPVEDKSKVKAVKKLIKK